MRDKQTFLMKGSFALLLFVLLGYMVKFYPETLVVFDQPIQTALRGDLPDYLTVLFRALTHLIDIPVIITWVAIAAFIFYRKQWKIESYFMAGNLALAGILIVLGFYLVSVLLSRVYLGVHYPSDVLASFCVGLGVLFIEFPFYDKLRFQWRFKGKQK